MDPSLLYLDKMIAILLETNGRASSSKQTKLILRIFSLRTRLIGRK